MDEEPLNNWVFYINQSNEPLTVLLGRKNFFRDAECSIWPCPCLEPRDFKAINENFNVGVFLEGKLADLRDATGRDFLSPTSCLPLS